MQRILMPIDTEICFLQKPFLKAYTNTLSNDHFDPATDHALKITWRAAALF